MRLTAGLLLAVALVAACTSPEPKDAQRSDVPTSSVTIRPSVTTPPGRAAFPDFNSFAPARIDDYTAVNWHRDRYVAFRTEMGVECVGNVVNTTDQLAVTTCNSIHMPGFPPDAQGKELRDSAPNSPLSESVTDSGPGGGFEFRYLRNRIDDETKVLPAGRRLVVNDTGCVAGAHVLACIGPNHHGFVIAESGSWSF